MCRNLVPRRAWARGHGDLATTREGSNQQTWPAGWEPAGLAADSPLVPKLCLGTPFRKLRFEDPETPRILQALGAREAELPAVRAQAELGHEGELPFDPRDRTCSFLR